MRCAYHLPEQGAIFPASYHLLSAWFPVRERTAALCATLAGATLGAWLAAATLPAFLGSNEATLAAGLAGLAGHAEPSEAEPGSPRQLMGLLAEQAQGLLGGGGSAAGRGAAPWVEGGPGGRGGVGSDGSDGSGSGGGGSGWEEWEEWAGAPERQLLRHRGLLGDDASGGSGGDDDGGGGAAAASGAGQTPWSVHFFVLGVAGMGWCACHASLTSSTPEWHPRISLPEVRSLCVRGVCTCALVFFDEHKRGGRRVGDAAEIAAVPILS